MSQFGDFTPDDAASTEPPDPLALARIWVVSARRLTGDSNRPATYEEATPEERALLLYLFTELVQRLVDEWVHS
jgi:hypothetical protein